MCIRDSAIEAAGAAAEKRLVLSMRAAGGTLSLRCENTCGDAAGRDVYKRQDEGDDDAEHHQDIGEENRFGIDEFGADGACLLYTSRCV